MKQIPALLRRTRPTGRDADPRRTIPLNSAAWQKLRATVLAQEPLCAHCRALGLTVLATDVDHVSGDPSDNRTENLQPLCHACHSRKTMHERNGTTAPMGFDAAGNSLDPASPWAAMAGPAGIPAPPTVRRMTAPDDRTVRFREQRSPATDDARPRPLSLFFAKGTSQ